METSVSMSDRTKLPIEAIEIRDANASGVSWGAVIGGAVGGASLSLILLALGSGMGLSAVSPWANIGASASAMGSSAIGWLVLMQILSSGLAGYLAGRLRIKWTRIHGDEIHFRDTAHGFLAWALGVVVTAYFLTAAASAFVGGTAQVASNVQADSPGAYYLDSAFRTDSANLPPVDPSVRAEADRLFTHAVEEQGMPAADKAHLAKVISARTGLTPSEAEQRIDGVMADWRVAADAARKATAHALLWIFLSLLIGAFSASYAATIGGRQRDEVKFA